MCTPPQGHSRSQCFVFGEAQSPLKLSYSGLASCLLRTALNLPSATGVLEIVRPIQLFLKEEGWDQEHKAYEELDFVHDTKGWLEFEG